MPKFKIKIVRPHEEPLKTFFQDFKRNWKLAEKRKLARSPFDLVLTFSDVSGLAKIFSPERMRLMMTVRDQKPDSIYQLAKLLGRAPANVLKDVNELAALGVLDLKKTRTSKQGRESIQPEFNWDGFDIAV